MIESMSMSFGGHAATKPDKVNIGITKDFKDQKFLISQLYHNVINIFAFFA